MSIDEQHPIGSGFHAATTASEIIAGTDLHGRTAVVTGGYCGLGLHTTLELAAAGVKVFVPARRGTIARKALHGVEGVTVIDDVDLADLSSVADCARQIAESTSGIDMVIAAAGVMATPQRPVGPGWDFQFAVNHLGHFALINRLFPLLAAVGGRVVMYSSAGHHLSDIRWDDLHFLDGYDKWAAYGQSKTANSLFAVHLDHLAAPAGVRAFALHPGSIITGLQRDLTLQEQVDRGWVDQRGAVIGKGFKTTSQGAATGLWAATSPALEGLGGLYLEDCDVASIAAAGGSIDDGGVRDYALNPESAERLWQLSAAMTAADSCVFARVAYS